MCHFWFKFYKNKGLLLELFFWALKCNVLDNYRNKIVNRVNLSLSAPLRCRGRIELLLQSILTSGFLIHVTLP